MSRHIARTTVRLNQSLMHEAKREAARRGITLTALIERGLGLALRSSRTRTPKLVLPVSSAKGGTQPGIELVKTSELLDILDQAEGNLR